MTLPCQICQKPSHGNHFGAISCRACSAFFRRSILLNYGVRKCVIGADNCEIENGKFFCKKCKFNKCIQAGMTAKKIQYNRDPLISTGKELVPLKFKNIPQSQNLWHRCKDIVPVSMTTFLGRPNCVLFCEPGRSPVEKCFIDFSDMIDKGARLLFEGCATPIFSNSNLKKLSIETEKHLRIVKVSDIKRVNFFGKEQYLRTIAESFESAAQWLTHFPEFQNLPLDQKMELMKTFWHHYSRYKSLFLTAKRQKELNMCKDEFMVTPEIMFDWRKVEIDFSWFSEYTHEQLRFFFDDERVAYGKAVDYIAEMDPTDIEATYMIGQFCFHYASKRLGGELVDVCDRLQDIISNELHNYYVNDMNISNYSTRLAKMMKINNLIQLTIIENRPKIEIAKVFNLLSVGYSHPELMEDF